MTTLSPSARSSLRQHLTENFSQAELEELAFDLSVDTETLLRETKSELARALILHFEDRDDIKRLAREVLARRPDPELERDLKNIEAQTADETTADVAPATPAPQPKSSTSKVLLLVPSALAVAALVAVIALLALRPGGGSNTSGVLPPSATAAPAPGIASDVPGTPLELNTTVRSGLDDTLKPRDVWRVRLQAQQPYTIEVRSSVQDGLGLGLLRPGASRAPDTVETADVNFCSYATSCLEPFTAAVTGDYYVVVYGMIPLVNYDLTVHDR